MNLVLIYMFPIVILLIFYKIGDIISFIISTPCTIYIELLSLIVNNFKRFIVRTFWTCDGILNAIHILLPFYIFRAIINLFADDLSVSKFYILQRVFNNRKFWNVV